MWFVYILECSDKSLYCGITNDLNKRIETHNLKKGAKYTRGRTPVFLVYFKEFETKGEVLKEEIRIKKLNKKQKLNLIQNNTL